MLWNSSENFVQFTSTISQTKKYSDAIIRLEDGSRHKVHKFLLARDSEFFRKLFKYQSGSEYKLSNVTSGMLEKILDWIYNRRMNLNTSDALKLLEEADYLCFDEVVSATIQTLQKILRPSNVLGIQSFCIQYNIAPLFTWCQGFTEDRFAEVSQAEEFPVLSPEQFKSLFLNGGEVSFVTWEALKLWIQHDKDTRLQFLPELLAVGEFEKLGDGHDQRVQQLMQSFSLTREEACKMTTKIVNCEPQKCTLI
jgi:hypothetical protein